MPSFSKFSSAVGAGFLLTAMQAAALTVNTPTQLTTCQPVLLAWSDGTGPFYPSIIPGGNPSGTPLKQFTSTSDDSLTWNVDLAADTSVTVAVTDSTGAIAYSAEVTILAGSDTSCVSSSTAASTVGGAAASGAASAGTSVAAAASSGTKRVVSSAKAAGSSVASVATGVASAAVSSASAANQAADSSDASKVATGFLGVIGSALLAAIIV